MILIESLDPAMPEFPWNDGHEAINVIYLLQLFFEWVSVRTAD